MYRKAPCRDSEWSHAASLQSLSCVYYVHSRRWNFSPLRVEAELNPLAKRDFGRFESVFCPFPNETVSQVARESAAEVQLVIATSRPFPETPTNFRAGADGRRRAAAMGRRCRLSYIRGAEKHR
jgi:hypothetical protein